jgi:hypothetical protein
MAAYQNHREARQFWLWQPLGTFNLGACDLGPLIFCHFKNSRLRIDPSRLIIKLFQRRRWIGLGERVYLGRSISKSGLSWANSSRTPAFLPSWNPCAKICSEAGRVFGNNTSRHRHRIGTDHLPEAADGRNRIGANFCFEIDTI